MSSDRLSAPVKVEAPPPPPVPSIFTMGLSGATVTMFETGGVADKSSALPSSSYAMLVESGAVTTDPTQVAALQHFDDIFARVVSMDEPASTAATGAGGAAGFFGGLFDGGIKLPRLEHDYYSQRWNVKWEAVHSGKPAGVVAEVDGDPHERGLYMHGNVGCGKTMLMDLTFHTLPYDRKKRVHFHAFMLDVHGRIHTRRKEHGDEADPIPHIAQDILNESWVLCFDEFQVTDIADAMVMARLFSEFFRLGGIVIATSNRAPTNLYENGLQRSLFIPFIKTLERQVVVHDMDSYTDYRLSGSRNADTFMYPSDDLSKEEVDLKYNTMWTTLTKGEPIVERNLNIQSRNVHVPEAAQDSAVARFSFADLCSKPLGAADYMAVASSFHTVFIHDVPVLDTGTRVNETRRFITLVDTFYEHHVKLIATAQDRPEKLLDDSVVHVQAVDILGTTAGVQDNQDEAFAFERTVSRLTEMQTNEYLQQAHVGIDA